MSTEKDGGSAFPSHGTMGEVTQDGMTLRDYFAAQALAGMMSRHAAGQGAVGWQEHAAWDAYSIANAMLAERGKADLELAGAGGLK